MSSNLASNLQPSSTFKCRPFVKWAGGKSQLLYVLLSIAPKKFNRFFEPFVGGGAVLFGFLNDGLKEAFIWDVNSDLVNAYLVVRDKVDLLIEDLKKHIYEEGYYYKVRNVDRSDEFKSWGDVELASRLIYLNKSCYNGLYRVNSKGEFNTPFGRYTNPKLVDEENLRACSYALRNTEIALGDFENIESVVEPGDFVYFDPPYVPLSKTSNFTAYSKDGFNLDDQKRLALFCQRLHNRKVKFLVSNSMTPDVIELYKQFKCESVPAVRAINSKASARGTVTEYLISNY